MHLDSEIRRAETVRHALAVASAEFRDFFSARGFREETGDDTAMGIHHLRVRLVADTPRRLRVKFERFWNQPEDIAVELLITDEEKSFWMNTTTNREFMSFHKALVAAVDGE